MFEVQLGASVLVRAAAQDGAVVRILADGGVKAAGYKADHVRQKVQGLVGPGEGRIDVIVGTHYDEDHLVGLVPIIESEVDIGEAWLPPIVDESRRIPLDAAFDESQLLGERFFREETAGLHSYLAAGVDACERVEAVESQLRERLLEFGEVTPSISPDVSVRAETDVDGVILSGESGRVQAGSAEAHAGHSDLRQLVSRLREYRADAESRLDSMNVDLLDDAVPDSDGVAAVLDVRREYSFQPRRLDVYPFWGWEFDVAVASMDKAAVESTMVTLAFLKRAAARDAINAAALAAVIAALKKRGIPIRYLTIEDGQPRTFIWDSAIRRFTEAVYRSTPPRQPAITLLAPSKGLVKKHRHRIPIDEAIGLALYSRLPIKSITASNQLSYVFRIDTDGQRILISGDTGFVDFALVRGTYHPRLLHELHDLDVVQVAHHGGRNAHFYEVLRAACVDQGRGALYLLLSHATHDAHRPSHVFAAFVQLLAGRRVELLFTSEPRPEKVAPYKYLISPVAPVGRPPQLVGDVALGYDPGNGWRVNAHAIRA